MFIIFAIYGFLVTAEKNIISASLFIAWLFYPLILFILDKLGKDIIRFYYEDKKNKNILDNKLVNIKKEIKKIKEELLEIDRLKKPKRDEYSRIINTISLDNYIKIINAVLPEVKKNERRARLNAYENRARFGSQQLKTQELSQIEIPYQCPYCENFSEVSNLELDHIHPTSWGGLSMRQNVILVCNECNRRKSNTPLRRFAINYNLNYEEICNRLEALGKFVWLRL